MRLRRVRSTLCLSRNWWTARAFSTAASAATAFSATGAMECQYAIKTGTLNSLSEQELVDCAGFQYGCLGCNGGQMTGAMKYAAKDGGLCAESEYKYEAKDGTCKASTCGTKYDANQGYEAVTPED